MSAENGDRNIPERPSSELSWRSSSYRQKPALDPPTKTPKDPRLLWRASPYQKGQWQGLPLDRQLLVKILPGVLLPLGLATWLSYALTTRGATLETQKRLQGELLAAAKVAERIIIETEIVTDSVAANPLIIEAARENTQRAQEEGIAELSIEEAEQRFANTLLLNPSQPINDYLKRLTQIEEIAELFFTEKNGFNVAYSQPTSDFVQRDESWWNQAKDSQEQLLIPAFDESANVNAIEIVERIADPTSGEFLGVLKAVVPAQTFDRVTSFLLDLEVFESEEAQIVVFDEQNNPTPLNTRSNTISEEANEGEATPAEVDNTAEILGGETIAQRAATLSDIYLNNQDDLDAAIEEADFPITKLQLEAEKGDASEVVLETELVEGNRQFYLSTIPKTHCVILASIERGEINAAGRNSALLFAGVLLAVAGISTVAIVRASRQVAQPLAQLVSATEEVARGNLDVYTEVEGAAETRQLANSFNALVVRVRDLLFQQVAETESAQQLGQITALIRESLDRTRILDAAVNATRQALRTDRTLVYEFNPQWVGTVIAESVVRGWPKALGVEIEDPCFAKGFVEQYERGRIQATENIYDANLTPCHIGQLESLGVKANLVAPILVGSKLTGLLIAHQCSGTRAWQDTETELMRQVAIQLGFALEQANLLDQREQARQTAEILSDEQRQQREALQQQLANLLIEVEGASSGDLTVRADVTAGEIGIVADFFNAIVESLRQIVSQVKQSATQVNASLGANEGAIRQLAQEALKQAGETTRTLDSVEKMTESIQSVARSARQAADVARTASTTARSGEEAMDRTVENISSLKETIRETADKVAQLGESSRQISKAVSLINEIALQTNVLAINAGLEAARAGEEAQGFAVVAEEVGELAERSAAATQEIEQLVKNIQLETTQVVKAMEQSSAQVSEGAHLVENTKQSLGEIVEVSGQIDKLVASISNATVSQVETSSAVSSLMQEIAQVSERTSDSSRQVSDSLRETVEISQELQTSVGTFKVDS
ncbi:GAF domain-containing protein [Oscillatoriales cyanobacterium LEGE 11467]|uniref:GAF domain-containing protein n=2 Tax=Zarconia TaxID=2992130 RepID=A0A928Z8F7_9CYAN|nr:GAF domain-containing protein [Zarconia navalis LEGE 11467]